ncbi:hypothetical protein QFZ54_003047 [Sphingomonas faeni]|nr:hypothetical protein [Sphingomonas faeni]
MDTKKRPLLVYLGKVSKETKAVVIMGLPELGNPILGYR